MLAPDDAELGALALLEVVLDGVLALVMLELLSLDEPQPASAITPTVATANAARPVRKRVKGMLLRSFSPRGREDSG
jgi:hypothetical protein